MEKNSGREVEWEKCQTLRVNGWLLVGPTHGLWQWHTFFSKAWLTLQSLSLCICEYVTCTVQCKRSLTNLTIYPSDLDVLFCSLSLIYQPYLCVPLIINENQPKFCFALCLPLWHVCKWILVFLFRAKTPTGHSPQLQSVCEPRPAEGLSVWMDGCRKGTHGTLIPFPSAIWDAAATSKVHQGGVNPAAALLSSAVAGFLLCCALLNSRFSLGFFPRVIKVQSASDGRAHSGWEAGW